MKVVSNHLYAASPAAVFAAMTTPEVLTQKYTALGHRDVQILEHVEAHGRVRVHSRRGVPMDVPGFARRFLAPVNTVEQTDEWSAPEPDGSRRGTWRVSASGVPVTTGGTLRLEPAVGGGTTVEVAGEVTCSIPLVGGKIASFVGADVAKTMRGEEDFNDRYLTDHPEHAAKARTSPTARPSAKRSSH